VSGIWEGWSQEVIGVVVVSYRWGLIERSSSEGGGRDIVGYKYLESRRAAQDYY
jgi:hypothetical protein